MSIFHFNLLFPQISCLISMLRVTTENNLNAAMKQFILIRFRSLSQHCSEVGDLVRWSLHEMYSCRHIYYSADCNIIVCSSSDFSVVFKLSIFNYHNCYLKYARNGDLFQLIGGVRSG